MHRKEKKRKREKKRTDILYASTHHQLLQRASHLCHKVPHFSVAPALGNRICGKVKQTLLVLEPAVVN